jgi:mannonate dehydratase
MKIGLGLYRNALTPENFKFARQAGCTHVVAHLVDYFRENVIHGTDDKACWGLTRGEPWTEDLLREIKRAMNAEGLEWTAIENLDPAFWHDVLLDGPKKHEQLEGIKDLVRRMGRVGIPVLGYNFSIAGVWGHVEGPYARGGAVSVGFLGPDGPSESPIPNGQVWNMIYDPAAPAGTVGTVTTEQLWDRLAEFLHAIVPVAEEAGVRLAAHPDDPPMPTLRGTARLVYRPSLYQKLLDIHPSKANALEFCLGSLQEMSEGDLYETVDQYSRQGAIAYVHFRNVKGKVPKYREVFVDEGDIDMFRVLRILRRNGFDGVLIPDHAPRMSCDAPWHAGMAYAIGYMQAALRAVEGED